MSRDRPEVRSHPQVARRRRREEPERRARRPKAGSAYEESSRPEHAVCCLCRRWSSVVALPAVVSNRAADDWPQWRGPNRDGRSAETGLLKDWPAGGPPLAWRATGAGEGYSSFATSQGRLFTLGARGGTEYVVAFDAASGKRLWETAHGTRFSNDRGDGPRATPTIEGDRVYAFGASGDLSVLDARQRQGPLDRQRAQAVPRFEHPMGAERIAARPGRSDPRQCRRDDRRAEEDRRQQDLDDRRATKRAIRRRSRTGRRRQRRRSSSRAGASSASTSAAAGSCGATVRWRTTSPTSRRRSCAATGCSCRRTTARGRRCSS